MKRFLLAAALLLALPLTVASATVLFPSGGGTGTQTPPTYGQMLVGNSGGTYTPTATSSLGLEGLDWTAASGYLTPTSTIGILVNASSTIGNGTATGGLTVSGGATTTGDLRVNGGFAVGGIPLNNSIQTFVNGTTQLLLGRNNTSGTNQLCFTTTTTQSTTCHGVIGWIRNNAVSATDGDMFFSTRNNNATNEIVRITSGGNVGIGTSSPYAQLTVATPNGSTGALSTLFAIASSTASATTTLFSVANTGFTNIGGQTAVSPSSSVLQAEGGHSYFGNEQNVINSIIMRRNGASVGGLTTTNSEIGIFGGSGASGNAQNSNEFMVTSANTFGFGTSTPMAMVGIQANSQIAFPGNLLFVIASSSVSASTTLFSVSNTGAVQAIGPLVIRGASGNGLVSISQANNATVQANKAGTNDYATTRYTNGAAQTVDWVEGSFDPTSVSGPVNTRDWELSQSTAAYPTISIQRSSNNVGIGTTSPFAKFSIGNLPSDTNTTLFAIASSTPTATTTLFAITSTGGIQIAASQPATSTAIVLDWNQTPRQVEYQIGVSATTITLINATTSQWWGSTKLIHICNPPAASAGAVTWSGILWDGDAVPTQKTTAAACQTFSFNVLHGTSTSTFIVEGTAGQGF